MHIPDGFLSGEAVAVGWAAGAAGLALQPVAPPHLHEQPERPDHRFPERQHERRHRVGVDHGGDRVGGVVEPVHELEAEREQQRQGQQREGAQRQRRLVRLWLDAPGFRNVPPEFNLFKTNGVPPQPGRRASYDFRKLYAEDPVASGGIPNIDA